MVLLVLLAAITVTTAIFFKWTKPESSDRLVGKLWLLPSRLLCIIELHTTPIYQKLENGSRVFKLVGLELETEKDTSDIFLVKFSFVYVMVSFGWISY